MSRVSSVKTRGFSLVELMVVVAIVGVLAALATFGVQSYVKHARTAEARVNIGQMSKDAAAAYARGFMAGAVLKQKKSVAELNRLCVSASRTVPRKAKSIRGAKYQSDPGEWDFDAKTAGKGFACLRFSVTSPQYFLYQYRTSNNNVNKSGRAGTTFECIAKGDQDADGKLSEFKLMGEIVSVGTGTELSVAPAITEADPQE